MRVELIGVPYDSGFRGLRMGRGPLHFIERGLPERLTALGHDVRLVQIESQAAFRTEVTTAFELNRLIAERVSDSADRFPLVLVGNCNTTLGVLSGMEGAHRGLVWFDAHGDYNTPETTPGGFFDGMGLAVITGQCWRPLASSVKGFRPLPAANVIHVGGRDFDPGESEQMSNDGIAVISPEFIEQAGVEQVFAAPLEKLQNNGIKRIHVHLDLDALDPEVGQANQLAPPGGLSVENLTAALQQIAGRFTISSAVISAYDPDYDRDDRVLNAGMECIRTILELAS